jgi:glycerophosphoryl diester phosphodiesterase
MRWIIALNGLLLVAQLASCSARYTGQCSGIKTPVTSDFLVVTGSNSTSIIQDTGPIMPLARVDSRGLCHTMNLPCTLLLRVRGGFDHPQLTGGMQRQDVPGLVIGHRGARSVAPENTLASISAAKQMGCTWVELDVMLTKDKVPVIHHDNTLDRCTNGKGNLWEYTLEEIEKLDAGSFFSAEFSGEKIPQLTTLLKWCRENSLGLCLEVKHLTENSSKVPTPLEQAMEEELAEVVCDTIEKCNVNPSELVCSSFSRPAIAVLRRRLPHFRCAFLVRDIPDDWKDFMTKNQCFSLNFWVGGPANTQDRIQECTNKVTCYVFVVNDGELASKLLSWGVSGVFSDCPHVVFPHLQPFMVEKS